MHDEIAAVVEGLIAADNAGDLDRIASLYAEDAVLLPPDRPAVRGRAAIREGYRQGFEEFALQLALESEQRGAGEDFAFDRGTTRGRYVWRDGRAPTPFTDTYLMILRREAGEWRVAILMWNHAGGA
jgi:uncharacterized protein (TIGR02246 family)